MKSMAYVQRFGAGIEIARRLLRDAGRPEPQFVTDATHVLTIVQRSGPRSGRIRMSIPVLTFFNNKGGVGKTSLVYHLAWMLSEQGKRILACDPRPAGQSYSVLYGR